MNGTRRLLTALLVATAAAVAVISYSGLLHFAELAELPMPWLWPVVLDLAAAGTAVAAWYAQALGHRAIGARAFTLALVAASAGLQMATAPTGTALSSWLLVAGIVGHGAAPAVLFGLLEVVLWTRRLQPVDAATATPSTADEPRPETGPSDGQAALPEAAPAPLPEPATGQPAGRPETAARSRSKAAARPRRGTPARSRQAARPVRTDDQLKGGARELADRLGMAPADLSGRQLRDGLGIGSERAARLREQLQRPALHAVDQTGQ